MILCLRVGKSHSTSFGLNNSKQHPTIGTTGVRSFTKVGKKNKTLLPRLGREGRLQYLSLILPGV